MGPEQCKTKTNLSNLNKEQLGAVNAVYGPVLVLAGPGSGKTHTLVERIRHMIEDEGISPSEILVITFSKKASIEMKERFLGITKNKTYPVYFGTFHAIFYNIVKEYYHFDNDSILTEHDKKDILNKVLIEKKIVDFDEDYKEGLISNISLLKNTINSEVDKKKLLLDIYASEDEVEQFLSILDEYITKCRINKKIDFDDMLIWCRNLLIGNEEILNRYRSRYKYFLVDEFQDINDVQYEVLMLLAGDDRNVFVVGDDDQSIYGFRGSKPELMQRFMNENKACKVIDLFRNYRCAECIIDVAGGLINQNKNRISKKQVASKENKEDGHVYVKIYSNASLEGEYVVDTIFNMKNEGGDLSNIAILYRTESAVSYIEEKLISKGIEFEKRTTRNNYYNQSYVKDIVAYLRLSQDKNDTKSLYRILNRPQRGLNRDDVSMNNPDFQRFMAAVDKIKYMTPFAAVNYILRAIQYGEYLYGGVIEKGFSIDNYEVMISELLTRAKEFDTIDKWIKYIDTICALDENKGEQSTLKNSNSNAINLLTAHASKGLEFETVFIIGLQDGIFPHKKAVTSEQYEEERRLLYVAMTRAKKNLFIIGRGEEKHAKRISPFIAEISCKYMENEV